MQDWRVDTFLSACETLNYTRTAERLNITQPAVSQHIAWLERQLGTRLFERHGRTLALTAAGETARDFLSAQRRDEALLVSRLRARERGRGRLRIGATLTAGEYLLARPLGLWARRHPEVRLGVVSADTRQLLAQLDDGEIDCALVEGFFDSTRYAARTWSEERMVCVCAPGDVLASPGGDRAGGWRLEDLLGRALVVREPGSGTRGVLEAALARKNLAPERFARLVEVQSLGVACELVEAGVGITFAYEPAVRQRVRLGTLAQVPLDEVPITHQIAFVWPAQTHFADEFQQLFDELMGMAAEDAATRSEPRRNGYKADVI